MNINLLNLYNTLKSFIKNALSPTSSINTPLTILYNFRLSLNFLYVNPSSANKYLLLKSYKTPDEWFSFVVNLLPKDYDILHKLLKDFNREKFEIIKSNAISLPLINIDTDMIIPKQFLKTIKKH